MPPHEYFETNGTFTYQDITTNPNITTINTNTITGVDWNTEVYDYTNITFVTSKMLEQKLTELKEKIYKIISEHTKIDISEEEFMNLLEE